MSFLYRDHRGGYAESMATCQTFETVDQLKDYLIKGVAGMGASLKREDISIQPYVKDNRNGWDTHIVSTRPGTDQQWVFGFTDRLVE